LNPIVVTPDQSERGSRDLSQDIIQELMKRDVVDVVGIGACITMVIGAVNLSKTIANVNIQSVILDYVPLTAAYKPEAIFFELSRTPSKVPKIVTEFDSFLEDDKRTKTIGVSREERVETITNIILWKLSKQDVVKVIASGYAVTTAIRSVLQVTTTGISKYKVGVTGIIIDSVERGVGTGRLVPAINIFIEREKDTTYSPRHQEVVKNVTAR